MTSMRPGLALAFLLIAAATLLLVIYRSQFPRGGVADQEQEAGPQLAEAAHWSAHQLAAFMRAREQLYARRRERVRRRCSSNPEYFSNGTSRMALVYDSQDQVAYCSVPKVASSTWCWHFIQLANISQEQVSARRQVLQTFAPSLWPAPAPEDLPAAWAATTSIVIVRHPLARLVSGYYQKFIKLAKHGTWAPKIRLIIARYRDKPNTGDQVHPSPQEFIRYVLDRLRANRRQTDPHWRPQYLQCPYCLVSFTVYSKMEELEADTVYFTAKANLTEKIEIDLKRNSMRNNDKQVEPQWTEQLAEEWAYGIDLEVFDYSLQSYFEGIGMADYLDS